MMKPSTQKILVGSGLAAAALTALGLYEHHAHASSSTSPSTGGGAIAAAPPYVGMNLTDSIEPGKTYLLSAVVPGGFTPAALMAALPSAQGPGFTVNQTWAAGAVPANWPSTDTDSARMRASVTYNGAAPVSMSTILSTYAAYLSAGGAIKDVRLFSTGS